MSKHFSPREFACHDGTPYPSEWLDNRLVDLTDNCLEIIREEWKFPILVVSGYRTTAYNKRVGGASKSQHVEGRAADIRPMRISDVGKLHAKIEMLIKMKKLPKLGGIGLYPGWIHVDVRPRPAPDRIARWNGSGNGSEVIG